MVCGIISNGKAKTQRKKIRTLHLTDYFPPERIIVSGDVGCQKPDREIFDLVARRFSFTLEGAWYIGDTFENDVAGAAGAGWKTIWMNRRNRQKPTYAKAPVYEVNCEKEMAALIVNLLEKNTES